MLNIDKITRIDGKRRIALLDTSSVSFLQGLQDKGVPADSVLKDYDLILIPEWVFCEIQDAEGRVAYLGNLVQAGYPIFRISEQGYSGLVNDEEGNLYQIVLASASFLGRVRSYLRRFVEKTDILDIVDNNSKTMKIYLK